MSGLKHAESFRDLIVYQKSRLLQKEIFKLTKSFPREEMFSLSDQIRRSSGLLERTSRRHGRKDDMKNIYKQAY